VSTLRSSLEGALDLIYWSDIRASEIYVFDLTRHARHHLVFAIALFRRYRAFNEENQRLHFSWTITLKTQNISNDSEV